MAKFKSGSAVSALLRAGPDAFNHIFFLRIEPPEDLSDEAKDILEGTDLPAIRLAGFTPPALSAGVQTIMYKGIPIERPYSAISGTREIKLSFRIDARYKIYHAWKEWERLIVSKDTFGSTNKLLASQYGKLEVYFPSSTAHWSIPDFYFDKGKPRGKDEAFNDYAYWKFYDVWVSNVTDPGFKQGGGDVQTFEATCRFHLFDPPKLKD